MTSGKGAVYATSRQQKINTHSSTEAELVGLNDMFSQILLTRYFLEACRYQCKFTPIYQDSMSTIPLAKVAECQSVFFINDYILKKEVKVVYCPIGDMTADMFIKNAAGKSLQNIRGLDHECTNVCSMLSWCNYVEQECAEKRQQIQHT